LSTPLVIGHSVVDSSHDTGNVNDPDTGALAVGEHGSAVT